MRSCGLILFGLMATLGLRAQFVDVTGNIELTSWEAFDDPAMVVTRSWNVHCVIGTNSWQITASTQGTASQSWWYTGSNLVWQVEAKASQTMDFNGDLDSGRTGSVLPEPARVAWIAFCSGSFLKRMQREVPMPSTIWKESWLFRDHAADPAGFKDQTVCFPDELALPISIDVSAKNGQPLFQYRAVHGRGPSPASTNVLGWNFPLEFHTVQYVPLRHQRDNWQVYLSAKGTLTGARIGAPPRL